MHDGPLDNNGFILAVVDKMFELWAVRDWMAWLTTDLTSSDASPMPMKIHPRYGTLSGLAALTR